MFHLPEKYDSDFTDTLSALSGRTVCLCGGHACVMCPGRKMKEEAEGETQGQRER